MARKKSIALTEKQAEAVELLANGMSETKVAKAIYNTNRITTVQVPQIKEALARARENLVDIVQIKRVDIVNGILDSIEDAKLMADPATQIRGWAEIGKLLGHYEPQVIKHEISMSQGKLQMKMESMSDEELLAIAEGATFEGEFAQCH
jgi:hypothetical protein